MCLSCKEIARQSCVMVPGWRFFGDFLRPLIFSEPRASVVWAHGRRQTDTHNRQTDTQTCMTTIHFASSTTHAKCNNCECVVYVVTETCIFDVQLKTCNKIRLSR